MNANVIEKPIGSVRAKLLLPKVSLCGCIHGGFARDTRGCALEFEQRFNYFAASPLCAITFFFEGDCHLLTDDGQIADPARGELLPAITFSGPQSRPRISWNPGDSHALMLAIYPEAFAQLTGRSPGDFKDRTVPIESAVSGWLLDFCLQAYATGDAGRAFASVQNDILPNWRNARLQGSAFQYHVSDWARSLATRAAVSSAGRGTRQIQRRIKAWTGHSLKVLNTYARSDAAFRSARRVLNNGTLVTAAEIAHEAGYSDQAHMSRDVRRQTGFAPLELLRRIETDEAFWSYRLVA